MHHASGAESLNTLAHTPAHTTVEFLMSEEPTGDERGETSGEKGRG